jgi:hypothetical protein
VAAPKAPSYAARERISVQKISNNGGNAMLKRILFFAYGSLSYLIFLGTFNERHAPTKKKIERRL